MKQLELIAGEYRIAVEAGEAVPASFTKRFYKGEETFTVTPGETTQADVNCRRQNTAAEVKFDASVATAFGTDFRFWIVADDASTRKSRAGGRPGAEITPLRRHAGYFTLPEGGDDFRLAFRRHPLRTRADRHGGPAGQTSRPEASMFTCLFSKDLPGFIQCVVNQGQHQPRRAGRHDHFQSRPHHREGDGFDIAQPKGAYIPGDTWTRSYKLAAMAPLKTAELRFGEQTYDLMMSDAPAEGITVVRDNDLSLTVTLSSVRRMSRRQSLRLVPHRRHEGRRSHRRLGTPRAGNPAGRKRGLRPLGQHGSRCGPWSSIRTSRPSPSG